MADYRSFFDRNWIAAFELAGADVTLTIAKAEGVTVQSAGGSAERKVGLHFHETTKGMVCNTTNGGIIASMYGGDVEGWIGKRITIFPTVTQMGREMKDCIRVRPMIPQGPPAAPGAFAGPPPPAGPVQHFSPGWPPPAQHATQGPFTQGGGAAPGLQPGWGPPQPQQPASSFFAPPSGPPFQGGYGPPPPVQQPATAAPTARVTPAAKRAAKGARRAAR
jgi:hypothetical protein